MSTTPTAALVEEAEALSRCATPAPWIYTRGVCLKHYVASENKDLALSFQSMHWEDGREVAAEADAIFIARARTLVPELAAAIRRAEAELDAATTQLAKKFKRIEELEKRAEKAEAERDEARREVEGWIKALRDEVAVRTREEKAVIDEAAKRVQAEAERDAQHAEVLRLTGELQQARKESLERARTVLMLDEDFDEACALGFGLGCMLTNAQWRERDAAERAQRGLKLMQSCLQDEERKVCELTATRDLLTAENARLQKEVATLELLRRGGH